MSAPVPVADRVLVLQDLLDQIESALLEGRVPAAIVALVEEYRELRREL